MAHIQGRINMKYVYLLESTSNPSKRYIGITSNLNNRLKEHNAGKSTHTSRFKPWKIVVAAKFADDQKAEKFEKLSQDWLWTCFCKETFMVKL